MPEIRPSPDQLRKLKAPLGKLIPGKPQETIPELKKLIGQLKPAKTVAVGDVVWNEATAAGVKVDLGIIDGKTMRHEYVHTVDSGPYLLHARNPAGTITDEAWKTVKDAMGRASAVIFVDGEEDLLTLPAVLEAPEGALVIYGQPSEGIVAVRVTREKKADLNRLLDSWRTGQSR